jgi:hypothetical protein
VHVVGACPSRGSQAIALGFDIGGRVAGDARPFWKRMAAFSPVFSCFLQKTRRTRPPARNEKPARGMPLALLA